MTSGERALVRISAALASRDESAVRAALEQALEVADSRQVEEALLQSYLFLGFPALLNGMAQWRRISGTKAPDPTRLDCVEWEARGHDVCGSVYSGQYEQLRENIRALHPDMEQWMVVEGYGKVLGRPGLALETRELCIVALLAVLETPKQLYSHLRGALNVGAAVSDVEAALSEADSFLDDDGRRVSRKVWDKVRDRYGA